MNTRHAWGFLSFGLVMGLLPVIAPAWFPPTGLDGTSGRALWLESMGVVQTALGCVGAFWRMAVPAFVRWLAFVPPPAAPVIPFEPEPAMTPAEPAFETAAEAA